jgi:glycosyltransferase involved in cell wall biosynthesis
MGTGPSEKSGEDKRTQGGCRPSRPGLVPPLVSIIVVVYRDREELARLLKNLTPFRAPEVELIVIDGGSQDGSIDLLRDSRNQCDYWLSEPDGGIYDAMNKGIAAARGEYILHINAGDELLQLPLAQLALLAQRQVDVVCCRVLEDGKHIFIPRNNWLLRFDNTWHHQGTFYRRTAHLGYDCSYRVFGDFDHNQRSRKAGRSVELLEVTIACHRTDGISRSQRSRHEIFRSIRSNFGPLHLLPAFARFQMLALRNIIRGREK